jgi:hypothetical protein
MRGEEEAEKKGFMYLLPSPTPSLTLHITSQPIHHMIFSDMFMHYYLSTVLTGMSSKRP